MKWPMLLAMGALITAPLVASQTPAEKAEVEVIAADRAFCAKAGRDGVLAAFLAYCTDTTRFLESRTLVGPPAARALYAGLPRNATLTWEPACAIAAQSGELAYTFGRYAYTQPVAGKEPLRSEGTYVTIWRRQADGSWKVALDGGSPDPGPKG